MQDVLFPEFLDRSDGSQATDGPDTEQRVGPVKSRNTAKQKRSERRVDKIGYNLAYFNLWWSRMAIEGRKEAKEIIRKKEEEVLARRKLVRVRRRKTEVVDNTMVPASRGQTSQTDRALRGGQHSNGGNDNEGEGRGSPVPNYDEMTYEQPQVPITVEKQNLDTVSEEGRSK